MDNFQGDGLSPDQRNVLKTIRNAGGSAKRAEIQKELHWGSNKTLSILKSLIKLKMILKIGQGTNVHYKLGVNCKFKDDEEKVSSITTTSKPPVDTNEEVADLLAKLERKGIRRRYALKLTYIEIIPLNS